MKRPTLRLLTVGHSYVVGLNRRLAHEMARSGAGRWEITAAAPSYFRGSRDLRPVTLGIDSDEPCRVVPLRAYGTGCVHMFWYGTRLRNLLARQWDVVHCWEEPYIVAGWQVAAWTPPSARLVVATFQNWSKPYPPPFAAMERASLGRAAGWLPFGRTVLDALKDRPGYRDRPHRVIPPGVDTMMFRSDPAAGAAVRAGLGWSDAGPPVVGYLGRFIPEKGIDVLCSAMEMIRSPWRALFVGAGPHEPTLRAFAARFPDRVRVCTGVSHAQVPAYLNAMDTLAAPSLTTSRWREQFGRMLIEAFACGIPVVGSDSGEIPYVIGDAGLIAPEGDAAIWAESIGGLIDNPVRRRELALAGRDRACREFAWPVVARQHLDFFESL